MAKRLQSDPWHHENNQSGCMWSLLTKLDFFRVSSILKLLSYRRRRNRHSVGGRCSRSRPTLPTRINKIFWSIDDSQEEHQPSSSCLCPFILRSLLIHKIEDQIGIGNKTEQPSPVEPFILGNVISNGSTGFQPVLQTSGLSWDELLARSRWHSSDQLLDTSFFDEVEILSGQLSGDRQLLLDCISEVLLEAYDCSFGYSPWTSFLKPIIRSLPVEENFIREVWECINWHLLPQRPHHTLDQIVRKDMGKANKWMDLKSNNETVGNEMGDIILEELIEDTMYQLYA